jgi:hypothetical protein
LRRSFVAQGKRPGSQAATDEKGRKGQKTLFSPLPTYSFWMENDYSAQITGQTAKKAYNFTH